MELLLLNLFQVAAEEIQSPEIAANIDQEDGDNRDDNDYSHTALVPACPSQRCIKRQSNIHGL